MNEKYIEAIYTQKGGKDVFGDYEKFKSLITTNDKYASNIYSKLGGKDAFGDYEKFRKLTKASEQAPIEQASVEKKKILPKARQRLHGRIPKVLSLKQTYSQAVQSNPLYRVKRFLKRLRHPSQALAMLIERLIAGLRR